MIPCKQSHDDHLFELTEQMETGRIRRDEHTRPDVVTHTLMSHQTEECVVREGCKEQDSCTDGGLTYLWCLYFTLEVSVTTRSNVTGPQCMQTIPVTPLTVT